VPVPLLHLMNFCMQNLINFIHVEQHQSITCSTTALLLHT
jgi:hypothetical protein